MAVKVKHVLWGSLLLFVLLVVFANRFLVKSAVRLAHGADDLSFPEDQSPASLFDLSARTLAGDPFAFRELEGSVVMVVNVASY